MLWTRLTSSTLLHRLGQEIVGPRLYGSFDVAQFVECRDHQHHDSFWSSGSSLIFLQTSKPLSLGIMMSSNNQVGLKRGDLVERILAVNGHFDLAVDFSQIGFEQFTVCFVIVRYQNS